MSDKIILKVGDILTTSPYYVNDIDFKIVGFTNDEIKTANTSGYTFPLSSCYYYVNGKIYPSENISIPENQLPITKDNLSKVLAYNKINNVKVLTNHISIKNVGSISFRSPNWLEILEKAIGKKLNPPEEEIILKVGDDVKFKFGVFKIKFISFVCYQIQYEGTGKFTSFEPLTYIDNAGIISVNGKKGRYIIPRFNFKELLLNHGFKLANYSVDNFFEPPKEYFDLVSSNIVVEYVEGNWVFNNKILKKEPRNAERLIQAASILEQLEI